MPDKDHFNGVMSMIQLYEMSHSDNPLRAVNGGVAPTLERRMGTGGNNVPILLEDVNKVPVVESRIRRLTPKECERLQGLPDDYTDVPKPNRYGKIVPPSDSDRYKAIGNGMAQPCADFVIRRIAECSD